MENNTLNDQTTLDGVYGYVMNDLPEVYVKYLEKRAKEVITCNSSEPNPTLDYFNGCLICIEEVYNKLSKILGISKCISDRISELNL